MMSEKARTYTTSAVSVASARTAAQRSANACMMRSIICASPGSLKSERK